MSKHRHDLDALLKDWTYQPGEVSARQTEGLDGRSLLHLRVEMGVLQLEVTGRPDGLRPEGHETYYDLMVASAFDEGDGFSLDPRRCVEIDREFVQFYHRRVAWLALREFRKAILDSDHTLALMDFSTAHAPNEDWVEMHEQYRPFVLFHRTQAEALAELEESNPQAAIAAIDSGSELIKAALQRLFQDLDQENFAVADADPEVDEELQSEAYATDDDEFLLKLSELRESIVTEYDLQSPLADRLADAIAHEQYELAAKLRDQIALSDNQSLSGERRRKEDARSKQRRSGH